MALVANSLSVRGTLLYLLKAAFIKILDSENLTRLLAMGASDQGTKVKVQSPNDHNLALHQCLPLGTSGRASAWAREIAPKVFASPLPESTYSLNFLNS